MYLHSTKKNVFLHEKIKLFSRIENNLKWHCLTIQKDY